MSCYSDHLLKTNLEHGIKAIVTASSSCTLSRLASFLSHNHNIDSKHTFSTTDAQGGFTVKTTTTDPNVLVFQKLTELSKRRGTQQIGESEGEEEKGHR